MLQLRVMSHGDSSSRYCTLDEQDRICLQTSTLLTRQGGLGSVEQPCKKPSFLLLLLPLICCVCLPPGSKPDFLQDKKQQQKSYSESFPLTFWHEDYFPNIGREDGAARSGVRRLYAALCLHWHKHTFVSLKAKPDSEQKTPLTGKSVSN